MPGTFLHDHHESVFFFVFTLLRNLVIFNDILIIFPGYYLNKYPIKSNSIPNCLGISPIESNWVDINIYPTKRWMEEILPSPHLVPR